MAALLTPLTITVNTTTATYNALGRMAEKYVGGVYTQFVYRPSGDKLAVYRSSLAQGLIPLPGGSTAIYNATGLNFIRHKDWLGSSRLATTWAHAVYSKEAYAPFGETYNEAGTADRSFTGRDQNVATGSGESGEYDFLFRKYDPSAGRWLSPDPAGWNVVNQADPQSLDRYAYVENQPVNWVDPYGLSPPCGIYYPVCSEDDGPQVSPWGEVSWSNDFYNVDSGGSIPQFDCYNAWPGPGNDTGTNSNSGGGGIHCLTGAGPLQLGQSRCVETPEAKQQRCHNAAVAAAAQIPLGLPDWWDVADGVVAGGVAIGITLAGEPEDGPVGPVAGRAAFGAVKGFLGGASIKVAYRGLLKGLVFGLTLQGCTQEGQPMVIGSAG